METSFAILRFEKLPTIQNVVASGQHNWRERETPNADASRTAQNRSYGAKSTAELVAAVRERIARVTMPLTHKKPVPCIEVLATAGPEWWVKSTLDQQTEFFQRAVKWLSCTFGEDNVVSMTIHRDETSPHLAAYVVPLLFVPEKTRKRSVIVGVNPDGTKRRETKDFQQAAGWRLSASHWLDGRKKLSQLQTEFAAEMKPLGLRRGIENSRAKHQSIRRYYARVNAPLNPLPVVPTPAPKPMPPSPAKPGLLTSRAKREKYEKWQAEAERRDKQQQRHETELRLQGAAAVKLVRELEPKAAALDASLAQIKVLEENLALSQSRAETLEQRVEYAETVAGLFSTAEIEEAWRRDVATATTGAAPIMLNHEQPATVRSSRLRPKP